MYVDAHSLLLKIVLHKCHVNKYNLYNQVGLIAINCMGEVGHGAEASTVGVPHQQEATFEEAMQLDPNTLERINALKKAKNQAVQSDDYDEAQRLKEAIERLRSIGTHLA